MAAFPPDHFDLSKREAAGPASSQCLEKGFLGRKTAGQRLGPVGPMRALRQLVGGVDTLLEPAAVRGKRLCDSEDHRALLDSLNGGRAP
jgi:hypothetical protein